MTLWRIIVANVDNNTVEEFFEFAKDEMTAKIKAVREWEQDHEDRSLDLDAHDLFCQIVGHTRAPKGEK